MFSQIYEGIDNKLKGITDKNDGKINSFCFFRNETRTNVNYAYPMLKSNV